MLPKLEIGMQRKDMNKKEGKPLEISTGFNLHADGKPVGVQHPLAAIMSKIRKKFSRLAPYEDRFFGAALFFLAGLLRELPLIAMAFILLGILNSFKESIFIQKYRGMLWFIALLLWIGDIVRGC
jgi:hypothetical protein